MINRFRLKSTNWRSNCWKPGSGLGPRMTLCGLYLAVKNTGDKTTTGSARNSPETLARFSSTPRCSGPGSMNWLIRKRSFGSSKTGRRSCKPRNSRNSSWNGNRADATKSISTTLFTVNASQSSSPTKTISFWPTKPWSMGWRTWPLSRNTWKTTQSGGLIIFSGPGLKLSLSKDWEVFLRYWRRKRTSNRWVSTARNEKSKPRPERWLKNKWAPYLKSRMKTTLIDVWFVY